MIVTSCAITNTSFGRDVVSWDTGESNLETSRAPIPRARSHLEPLKTSSSSSFSGTSELWTPSELLGPVAALLSIGAHQEMPCMSFPLGLSEIYGKARSIPTKKINSFAVST